MRFKVYSAITVNKAHYYNDRRGNNATMNAANKIQTKSSNEQDLLNYTEILRPVRFMKYKIENVVLQE